MPVLDVATRYSELGEALLPIINPILGDKYGLEMPSFILENVSVPPEVEAAIDKRSSMAAVGNLNDYVKFQMAQGMAKGGSGVGGVGAEMAVGMAMAQQMMNQPGGIDGADDAGRWRGAAAAAGIAGDARVRPTRRRRSASPRPMSSRASRPAISRASGSARSGA